MNLKCLILVGSILALSCQENKSDQKSKSEELAIGTSTVYLETLELIKEVPENITAPEGMVWIPGDKFIQGAQESDGMAMDHEKPAHPVAVDGFFMDEAEVTNAQFQNFIDETGYTTIAEREIVWEEMKKQLPFNTPKPHDSILQPGSLIFKKTEAEWELAAQGGQPNSRFSWVNDETKLAEMANTWEGEFPTNNLKEDGYENKAPVKSYPPNPYGLYDMAGNVWEWTQDWYNVNFYQEALKRGVVKNPKGAEEPFNLTTRRC